MRYTSGHRDLLLIFHLFFDLSNALRRHHNAVRAHSFSQQIIFKEGAENSHCPLYPTVPLPTQNATRSFWLASLEDNPLAEEGSKGELTESADVCIIGTGITGVSSAWHLSQMMREYEFKTNVVVLEAREFCSGATGRNGGHLSPNAFSSFVDLQSKYNTSEAIKSYIIERYTADSLVKFLKDKKLENNVDLFEGGRVTLLKTVDEERAVKADFAAASAAGLDLGSVRWITNQNLTEEYGLNPNFNYTGVWWPAHNLWPCKLVTELFKDAQGAGGNVSITLHTKTPVTSILRQRRGSFDSIAARWALQTPRGSILCNYVIHATNAYAGHLLPLFAGLPEAHNSSISFSMSGVVSGANPQHYAIIPTRGQVAAVRASVAASRLTWRNGWSGSGGWEYWFPRFQGLRDMASGRPLIILGGGREFSGNLETGESDDGAVNPRVTEFLKAFLPQYFPTFFKESEMESNWEMEWTGIMGNTKTRDPFVGPVLHPSWFTGTMQQNPYDGQYISAGYTGHGMVRAYACAEAVAGMIKSRIIGEKWVSPEWLPERYLTWATR